MKKLFLFFICLHSFLFSQTVTVNTDLVYRVNLPAVTTKKTPMMIMLHGYGSNESDLFELAKSIDERFLTFSLRAPLPARDQGYCWYKLEYVNGERTHDYKEAKESRAKILSFISAACKAYKADSTQVFIMGFSQGAIMCFDLALNRPDKIKGVVALSGLLLGESKKVKMDPVKTAKLRFFVAHGTMDNIIAYKEGESAVNYLKEKKIAVDFKSYEIPHSISGKELNDIKDWLKQNLPKEKKEDVKK